jgi:hypothetical protein
MTAPDAKVRAKAYFEWFVQTREERVEELLRQLRVTKDDSAQELLRAFGLLLNDPHYWNDGKLSAQGIAACRDFGTLLGGMLISRHPTLCWHFNDSRYKDDVYLWRPVISGFKGGVFEPVMFLLGQARDLRSGRFERSDQVFGYWDRLAS